MGGRILVCANPTCAEVRLKHRQEWQRKNSMEVETELPPFQAYKPRIKVYPGQVPLCTACKCEK